ncbi:MAG: response regulator [Lachnospiraceae bacterium]|nr:response regulator [Robinsoniella sp.]MDY3766949.1 response regulator [Lachnospiraceae bacterium]
MYQIAVCDDDIYFLDKFTKTLLYAWGEEQVEIQTYQDGQTLLEDVERGNRYQVFFLDIQLASENGIDVARKLKIYSSDSVLIYVSAMEECIFQTFQTFPFWFVRKGKLDEDLRQMLPELRKQM